MFFLFPAANDSHSASAVHHTAWANNDVRLHVYGWLSRFFFLYGVLPNIAFSVISCCTAYRILFIAVLFCLGIAVHLLCQRQHLRPEDVGNSIWLSVSAGLASHHILSLTPGRVWRKLSHLHRSCLWKDGELVRSRVWYCLFRMGYDNISCYHQMQIWTQLRSVENISIAKK